MEGGTWLGESGAVMSERPPDLARTFIGGSGRLLMLTDPAMVKRLRATGK
jgi:hypothetical protein